MRTVTARISDYSLDGVVAHGGIGFWRSLIRLDLISATAFGNGITELAVRRLR